MSETIVTRYSLGQTIYRAIVERVVESRDCRACNGRGYLDAVAEDGSKHEVKCPDAMRGMWGQSEYPEENLCVDGKIKAGVRHALSRIESMTVGEIRIEYGRALRELVMCEETGVGSGSLWDVREEKVHKAGAWHILASESQALLWADGMIRLLDERLRMELLHAEALDMAATLEEELTSDV